MKNQRLTSMARLKNVSPSKIQMAAQINICFFGVMAIPYASMV